MLTFWDRVLISFFILLAIIGLVLIKYYPKKADIVSIQSNGKEILRVPLNKDNRLSVDGLIGKTEIEIKDRRVRITDSPCDRKICVHSQWIEKPYETIACVPNRVVISLISQSKNDSVDAVTR